MKIKLFVSCSFLGKGSVIDHGTPIIGDLAVCWQDHLNLFCAIANFVIKLYFDISVVLSHYRLKINSYYH